MARLKHRRFFLAGLVLGLVLAIGLPVTGAWAQSQGAPIVIAQENKPRTLFDWLFGTNSDQQPAKTPAKPADIAPKRSPSIVSLEDIKPSVEKAANATRLAVFGDSLAVDLAKALERAHSDDPNIVIMGEGVGSSGFVRDDFYDWNGELAAYIRQNAFDIAVIIIGINDRQPIGKDRPLTDDWKAAYQARLTRFLDQMRAANKPVIWVGLPPMRAPTYSAAMSQISSLQRLAAFAGGAEFVDIYERFVGDNGTYSAHGPDLSGQDVSMRKSDGIHFSAAGSDKVAFYVDQALKRFYQGGSVTRDVADLLAGTDAETMVRMPFQGLGQFRPVEVAGAVMQLGDERVKAADLVIGGAPAAPGFRLDQMVEAPVGRADAFGVGVEPGAAPGGR